jgi:hypothetical protein
MLYATLHTPTPYLNPLYISIYTLLPFACFCLLSAACCVLSAVCFLLCATILPYCCAALLLLPAACCLVCCCTILCCYRKQKNAGVCATGREFNVSTNAYSHICNICHIYTYTHIYTHIYTYIHTYTHIYNTYHNTHWTDTGNKCLFPYLSTVCTHTIANLTLERLAFG